MKEWMTVAEYFSECYLDEARKSAKYAERRTGFDNLDGTGRFAEDGQKQIFAPGIYFLGAPPSAGKTTYALQLTAQLSDRGEECLFVSYEMSVQALCRKLIARALFEKKQNKEPVTLLSNTSIRRAGDSNQDINVSVHELADTLNHLTIRYVDWDASTLIKKLRSFVSGLKRPPVICVDYLQLVPSEDSKTAKEKVDFLLSALRKFQNDTDSTLILISAFNRANGLQAEASFASFKESGSIEYTGDVIWALEPAIEKDEPMSVADKRERQKSVRALRLRCLKSREGALFEVYYKYYAPYDTFVPCPQQELFEGRTEHLKYFK